MFLWALCFGPEHLKLAKLKGEYVWHSHDNTDELFLVLRGSLRIDYRDESHQLGEGDLLVVPKNVEHRPVADDECHVLLIERTGTVNSGDAVADGFTSSEGEWI